MTSIFCTQVPTQRASGKIRQLSLCLMTALALISWSVQAQYDISTASYLGGSSDEDEIRGTRILSDGTIVIIANIGSLTPGGVTPILLNGATASSGGVVIRLTGDGQTVLSVTRIADQVNDMSIDGSDNIYVALHLQGFVKLNSTATTVLLQKDPGTDGNPEKTFKIWRIDAAVNGTVTTLQHDEDDLTAKTVNTGLIRTYDSAGTEIGAHNGWRNTLDICIDGTNELVIFTGWRQANAFDGNSSKPVQISYIRATSYDGTVQWTSYDWSTDQGSDDFINKPENNMADSRGLRCSIGRDGKLYAAFQVAGGNHIFRYEPFDIDTKVTIVGGDNFHEFWNTHSENKSFFARYEPTTGDYLVGQQFLARKSSDNGGNTAQPKDITADSQGRVYLFGNAAYGIPIPPHSRYTPAAGQTTFNPFEGYAEEVYLGGGFVLVMSQDMATRLYCTRLSPGAGVVAGDARIISGTEANIAWGGAYKIKDPADPEPVHVLNAVQSSFGGGTHDAYFASIGTGTVSGPGTLGLTSGAISVDEDAGTVTLNVARTGGSDGAVGVDFATADGSATAGGDYTADSGTLNWADGESGSKSITISIIDDSDEENAETFDVNLSNFAGGPSQGTSSATVTINASDVPVVPGTIVLDTTAVSVDEDAGTVSLTVTRTGGSDGEVSIDYATADGTATDGSDYTAASGTLTWADGNTDDKTVVITITDDADDEADETLTLSLSNATGGATLGDDTATITIVDNDVPAVPGTIALDATSVSVDEDTGTVTLTVTRSGGNGGEVSIDYATADGTATSGSDYTAASGTLTWADGNADDKTVVITITDDTDDESDETLTLNLSNATGGATLGDDTATITIVDNDNPGVITLPTATADVQEDAGTISVTVSRTGGNAGEVSVYYETVDNTAAAGSDYTADSGTLTWANGNDDDKTIQIAITDDAETEGDESFTVELSSPTGGATLDNDVETITITANDSVNGTLGLTVSSVSVNEDAGTVTLTISRTGGSTGAVSVDYATADGTAAAGSDYTSNSGTLAWEDGSEVSKDIVIDIIDDADEEDAETFTLALSNATGGANLGTSSATVTINASDPVVEEPGEPPVGDDDDDGCHVGFAGGNILAMLAILLGAMITRFRAMAKRQ